MPAEGQASVGLPADMLTAAESARAADLALAAPEVHSLIAGALDRDGRADDRSSMALAALAGRPTYRVLYTERAPDKNLSSRYADVALYRYDDATAVLVRVDLRTAAVDRRTQPAGYPLPLVPEEIAEAARVARRHDTVRTQLAEAGLDPDAAAANGILTSSDDPASPCARHRCVRLFFSSFRSPAPTFSAVVDLVTMEVESVAPTVDRSVAPTGAQSNLSTDGRSLIPTGVRPGAPTATEGGSR